MTELYHTCNNGANVPLPLCGIVPHGHLCYGFYNDEPPQQKPILIAGTDLDPLGRTDLNRTGSRMTSPQLIEVDSRRRVALGRLGDPDHTRYIVTEHDDGSLLFEPAIVRTAHEEALLRNPEILKQVEDGFADKDSHVKSASRARRKARQ